MPLSRLEQTASLFSAYSEALHTNFLEIIADQDCTGCRSSGFGKAILTAWLQARWIDFNHDLVVASALGTRRRNNSIQSIAGANSRRDAERIVRKATACTVKKHGLGSPVWHAPWFVVEVGATLGLNNIATIEAAMAHSTIPEQIASFRNYLVHPGTRTQLKYNTLQAKLGMLQVQPEDLLDQFQSPGVFVFTAWVGELQRIAYAATQ